MTANVHESLNNAIRVPGSKARFAYTFYATNNHYAVAAMAAARALMLLEGRPDVDFVVLHHGVNRFVLRGFRELGVYTKKVLPVPYAAKGYFEESLTKLRVLQLQQYDRAVFIDADALPLRRMDDLFTGEWSAPIAAPRAYWLPNKMAMGALFAFRPSPSLWMRVSRHFPEARAKRFFDMDIINLEFGDDLEWLPDGYLCLNSEYGDCERPTYFGDPAESYGRVKLIHFSDLGKPWFYRPEQVRKLRPNAHPQFYTAWEEWWKLRDEVIATQRLADRMKHRLLSYRAGR